MRPSNFQDWLVLFWIKCFALRIHRRGYWAEKILAEHIHNSRVHWLGDDGAVIGHIVQKLVKRKSLDLFGFHISRSIIEIEDDVALIDLLHEQVLSPIRRNLVETWKLL